MARHQDDEKRQRILKASVRTFSEKGFTTTTMKDIAVMAGIAPGSIYTYYEDKEILFIAAVDKVWKGFHRGLASVMLDNPDFDAQFAAMLDYSFDLLTELHPLLQGMYQEPRRLNLFHKNIVKLAKQLSFFFEKADPRVYTISRFGKRHRMHMLKIWISGVMFTFASLPPDRLEAEILQQKNLIRAVLAKPGP